MVGIIGITIGTIGNALQWNTIAPWSWNWDSAPVTGNASGGRDEERLLYGRYLVIGSEWEVPPGGLNRKRPALRTIVHIGSRLLHPHLSKQERLMTLSGISRHRDAISTIGTTRNGGEFREGVTPGTFLQAERDRTGP